MNGVVMCAADDLVQMVCLVLVGVGWFGVMADTSKLTFQVMM